MKLRCKKGDIAIIIRGDNSGKYVEVLEYMGPGQPGEKLHIVWDGMRYVINVRHTGGYFWWCKARTPLRTMDEPPITTHLAAIPDHFLLPIRPLGEKLEEAEIIGLGKPHEEPV